MAFFYFDNSNPMRNLPLAMKYICQAEQLYADCLETDNLRPLSPLMRKGITLSTLRQTRQAISDAASNTVRLHHHNMSALDVELYLEAFPGDKEMVNLLRQRRISLAFADNLRQATPEAYYQFIVTYPSTHEAEQMEELIAAMADTIYANAYTDDAIDSLKQLYSLSPAMVRAAERRRSKLAFEQASQQGTAEAYRTFLQHYPSSNENIYARERLDALTAHQYTTLQSARDLADFAKTNSLDTLADDAVSILKQRIINDHDVDAARTYLAQFPNDIDYYNIYNIYYSWHAAEGNSAPLRRFAQDNPSFPRQQTLEDDLERARQTDRINLLDDFLDARFDLYADLLRNNMDLRLSYVILQRMIQNQLATHDYAGALSRARQFEICFDNTCSSEYTELLSLLSQAPQQRRIADMLAIAGSEISHPSINHADSMLYFTRTSRHTASQICCATIGTDGRWSNIHPLRFANAENSGITLFSFTDNGHRMLLGIAGDIWIAERDGDQWRLTDLLPYPVNTEYLETDAFMLPDGSGILLASDRPGGHNLQQTADYFHGDTAIASDIYFIPCHAGIWAEAINLGTVINTPYCESSPLLSHDGHCLYYVTDSRGLGYGDIYMATRDNTADWTHWNTRRNLGLATNSGFAETTPSFGWSERELLFASNRNGHMAILSTAAIHNTSTSQSTLTVHFASLVGNVNRIRTIDLDQQHIIAQYDVAANADLATFDFNGSRRIAILTDAATLFVPAIAVEPGTTVVTLHGYTLSELAAATRPLPLPLATFDGNEPSQLTKLQLQQLSQLLSHADGYTLELIVNVAGLDDEQCYTISQARGQALVNHLTALGIDPDNITVSAYGNAMAKRQNVPPLAIRLRQQ